MLSIPSNVRNVVLYEYYLNLLKKVIAHYHELFERMWQIKNSRDSLDYDPILKFGVESSVHFEGIHISFVDEIRNKEDISLIRFIDFTVDGLYNSIKILDEYVDCVRYMTSDPVIGKQVNRSLSLLYTHQHMGEWKYISHFLKSAIYHYFNNHQQIEVNKFNKYFSDLESFFYESNLDMTEISPLHHFKFVGLTKDNQLSNTECSIILSEYLRIVPISHDSMLRLWNKFPVSRFDNSNDEINYLIKYNFKVVKGFDTRGEIEGKEVNIHHIFATIVTLFRLVDIHCGIHDTISISELDLPILHMGLNLFVSSLGVAYANKSLVHESTLKKFMRLWTTYGDLLVKKVLNNQRFPDDPFGNLKISINRFNTSFERKDGTDQFIDNIVALEALFSKKDDPFQGITVRISKRIALFLEVIPQKRKEIFCEMLSLYDSRGRIIHGGYTDDIDIVKTRDYLIRSYLKYFDFLEQQNFSHTKFIEDLDNQSKSWSIKRKNCKPKHQHNSQHITTIPDFLFQ